MWKASLCSTLAHYQPCSEQMACLLWPHTGQQLQRATALWSHCANRYEKTHSFTRGLAQSDFSKSLSSAPQCLPMSLLRQFIYYGKMHTPQNVLSTFKGAFGDVNYIHPS